MGRVDVVRLLVEPEEVHSRNEDGLCGVEEAARQSGFDRVFERVHEIIRFSSPLCVFYSPNHLLIPLYLIIYDHHAHPFFFLFFALLFSLNFFLNFFLNFEALSLFSSIDASGEVFFQSLSLSLLLLLPLLLLLLLLDGIVE